MPDPNVTQVSDAYGHDVANPQVILTAGAVGTTAAGTVVPLAGAGTTPVVTFAAPQACVDMYGAFTLTIGAAGAPAAGAIATIYPRNSYPRVPRCIQCTIYDNANAAALALGAITILASSFQVAVGVPLTASHAYTIVYRVFL
jgi:hypothetical protein